MPRQATAPSTRSLFVGHRTPLPAPSTRYPTRVLKNQSESVEACKMPHLSSAGRKALIIQAFLSIGPLVFSTQLVPPAIDFLRFSDLVHLGAPEVPSKRLAAPLSWS